MLKLFDAGMFREIVLLPISIDLSTFLRREVWISVAECG